MKRETYEVTFTYDRGGWWTATVPSIDGCFTQGDGVAGTMRRVLDAIETMLELEDAVLPEQIVATYIVCGETIIT